MTKTYNPFDLDKPTYTLGDSREYILGDITESRRKRMEKLSATFEAMPEDSEPLAHVEAIAELIEAATENSEGVKLRIVELYTSEKIGMKSLTGLASFVQEWLIGEVEAGN